MSKEAMKLALEAAYLAGWNASGEGYNSEYPFGDHARNPEEDAAWLKDRDNALREALAEKPAPPPECQTEAEKTAYAFGWFKALETVREQPAQQEQNRQIDQLIQERDHRDEIIDKLCDAVLGPDRYEWSSQYFFEDAVREVEERMAEQPAQQEPVKWSSYEPDGTHHNKPAQSKQKPVAWLKAIDTPGGWGKFVEAKPNEKGARPVYTSPPASKPWVGLTDEEMNAALDYWSEDERSAYGGAHAADGEYVSMIDTWRYIEAKLRERNT